MGIKITAARRDDILRERDAYNAERKKNNDVYKQQEKRYRMAQDFNEAQVENAIRSQVPGLDGIDIRIEARWYGEGIKVEFVDEDRSDNKALRWRWSVTINSKGEIKKESSSWSGLEAVTPEQLADLQRTVNVITNLMNVDWAPILQAGIEGTPDYYDYMSLKEMPDRSSEFNRQLKEAGIEDIIGQEKWVKGQRYDDSGYGRGDNWYMIHSQTEKFYTVSQIRDFSVESTKNNNPENLESQLRDATKWPERVKKEKILPKIYFPLEIMNMDGSVETVGDESTETEASTNISSGLITL